MFRDCANFLDCPPHILQVDINTPGSCVDTTAPPGTMMTAVCSWSLALFLLLVTVQATVSAPAGTHAEVTFEVNSTITLVHEGILVSGIDLFKMGQCEDDIKIQFPLVHSILYSIGNKTRRKSKVPK